MVIKVYSVLSLKIL